MTHKTRKTDPPARPTTSVYLFHISPTPLQYLSFLCSNYYRRLQLSPADVLGRPLSSIVDPLDVNALQNAIYGEMAQDSTLAASTTGGTLIHLRVACGGWICQASMTLVVGTQGLIVVTRLYGI